MALTAITLDGHDLNDTTNYTTKAVPEGWSEAPEKDITIQPTAWGPGLPTIARPGTRTLTLLVSCNGATPEVGRRNLLQWLKVGQVEGGDSPHTLVITDSTFAEALTVTCFCQSAQFEANVLYLTLVCADPIKYGAYSTLAHDGASGSWSGSARSLSIPNTGDTDMPLLIRAAPGGTLATRNRVYVTLYNRLSIPLTGRWMRLTWDHQTNVGASRSQADADDVRVYVDGKEVPRYVQDANTATTKVWFKVDLPAYRRAYLNNGPSVSPNLIANTDNAPFEIRLSTAGGWPSRGYLLIDSEVFAYKRVTGSSVLVQITRRACWQTSAANHGYAAAVIHLPHEVVMQFGDLTATAPTYTTPAPAFLLDTSTNVARSWAETGLGLTPCDTATGKLRDEAWKYANVGSSRGKLFRGTVPSGGYGAISLANTYAGFAVSAGAPGEVRQNTWLYYSDVPIDQISGVRLFTSSDPAHATVVLGYRDQAKVWQSYVEKPAASNYSATETNYGNPAGTPETVADTSTGLNASGAYIWLYDKPRMHEDVSPPYRFRLDRITVAFDSTKTPFISPSGTIHGTTGHVAENLWGITLTTTTGKQRMEVGLKHNYANRALVINSELGQVYWLESTILLTELLDNTGFEDDTGAGLFDYWDEDAGDGALAKGTAAGEYQAGSVGAKLTAGATFNTLVSQDEAGVSAGQVYRLSFWARGDATNAGRYSVYDVTNAAYITGITTTGVTSATYAQVIHTFVIPTGCTQIRIQLRCPAVNAGIACFDTVSLLLLGQLQSVDTEYYRTQAKCTVSVLHQGGQWMTVPPGGDTLTATVDGCDRANLQIIGKKGYL